MQVSERMQGWAANTDTGKYLEGELFVHLGRLGAESGREAGRWKVWHCNQWSSSLGEQLIIHPAAPSSQLIDWAVSNIECMQTVCRLYKKKKKNLLVSMNVRKKEKIKHGLLIHIAN